MKSVVAKVILAAGIIAAPSVLHAQSGGAVSDSFYSQAPTLVRKGVLYTTGNLVFNATPPAGSFITIMAWTWSFSSTTPPGTVVNLCYNNGASSLCFDISQLPSGSTTYLENLPAVGAEFSMTFKVPGTGYLAPTLYPKNTDQVILNYQDAN